MRSGATARAAQARERHAPVELGAEVLHGLRRVGLLRRAGVLRCVSLLVAVGDCLSPHSGPLPRLAAQAGALLPGTNA